MPKRTGRPTADDRAEPTAASLNARVTSEQYEYLRDLADELNGSLSAAVRRAIDQSRLFELASGKSKLMNRDGSEQDPENVRGIVLGLEPRDELDQEQDPA